MKKVMFLLAVIMFASCQNEIDNSTNGMLTKCYVKGDVLSITSKITSSESDGDAIIEEAEFENGQIKTYNVYSEGELGKSVRFSYEDGKVVEVKTLSGGEMIRTENYTYEGDKVIMESDGMRIVIDKNGFEAEGYSYRYKDGYMYEGEGEGARVEITRNAKNDISEIQSAFLSSGIFENFNFVKDVSSTYRYEYDKTGNWTKREIYIMGKLIATMEREIMYN